MVLNVPLCLVARSPFFSFKCIHMHIFLGLSPLTAYFTPHHETHNALNLQQHISSSSSNKQIFAITQKTQKCVCKLFSWRLFLTRWTQQKRNKYTQKTLLETGEENHFHSFMVHHLYIYIYFIYKIYRG